MSVAADDAAAVRRRYPVQTGEPAARLLDDDLQGRQVPERDVGLGRDVDRALRDQHVRPEVAEAAGPPDRLAQRQEPVQPARLGPAADPRVGERRVRELADLRYPAPAGAGERLAGPGAAALGGPP